ncbi:GNAT family N-acetyltransferase [Streptomyces violaceusniger]|uniref:GNAT family N-acetyltransferase n=1 Tax=Streptomyces violaceusniger TaxID=68280 RepID=UPI00382AE13F
MGKRTTKKTKRTPPLSAERLRSGWSGPAGTRIHLARPGDAAAADALMTTTGDEVRIIPVLREAIENGTAGSAILAGLGAGAEKFHNAAARSFSEHGLGGEALSTVCLVLVATDEHDQAVGVLTATAPGTLIQMATTNGYTPQKATALSVFVAKLHGIAVAEHARRQGIAAAMLKRAWQVYQQLGYFLLYGSYEADRDHLRAFYTRCGYTVYAPGEGFSLERIALPFGLHAGPGECMFTRWRPNH